MRPSLSELTPYKIVSMLTHLESEVMKKNRVIHVKRRDSHVKYLNVI